MKILIILGLIIINIALYKHLNTIIENKKIENFTPTDVSGNKSKTTDASGSPIVNKTTNATKFILIGVLIFAFIFIVGFLIYVTFKSKKDEEDDGGRKYSNDDNNYSRRKYSNSKKSKGRNYSNDDDNDDDNNDDNGGKIKNAKESKGKGFFKKLFSKKQSQIENDNRLNKLRSDANLLKEKQYFIFNSNLASLLTVAVAKGLYNKKKQWDLTIPAETPVASATPVTAERPANPVTAESPATPVTAESPATPVTAAKTNDMEIDKITKQLNKIFDNDKEINIGMTKIFNQVKQPTIP
jgi:hypothetical protein